MQRDAEVIPASLRALRFGVVDSASERLRHSNSYVLKAGQRKGDVYLLNRRVGDRLKVSLHPGLWKLEHDGKGRGSRVPSRTTWEPPPPDDDGKQLVFRILLPASSVDQYADEEPPGVVWVEIPVGCPAVEFLAWLVPALPPIAASVGPGELGVGLLALPALGRSLFLLARAHKRAPVTSLDLRLPQDADLARIRQEALDGRSQLGLWGILDGVCVVIDKLMPTQE